MRIIFGLFVFAFLLGNSSAPAEAKGRVALVVGMSAYSHAGQLKNPVNDAQDIAQSLEQAGFDVLLALDLTIDQLDQKVEEFIYKLSGADAALFYYAGHGLQYRGQNFLVPVDARLSSESSIRRETFGINYVVEKMEELSPLNLIFLDACRNNPLAEKLQRSIKVQGRSLSLSRGLAPIETQKGDSLIVFATAPGDVAADGAGRNSPFTSALLHHIRTPGLEVEVMLKRVKRDVREMSNGQQSPETLSRLAREFVFFDAASETAPKLAAAATRPAPAAIAKPRQRSEAAIVWQDIRQTSSAGILQTFIQRFPGTVYADFAKARLGEITTATASRAPAPSFDPSANPSFSCSEYTKYPDGHAQRTPQTDLLCIDSKLADADRRMGNLYGDLAKRLSREQRAELKEKQKAWIARRDTNCPATWEDLRNAKRVSQVTKCILYETLNQNAVLADWMRKAR